MASRTSLFAKRPAGENGSIKEKITLERLWLGTTEIRKKWRSGGLLGDCQNQSLGKENDHHQKRPT
jgi:hypothetical protein